MNRQVMKQQQQKKESKPDLDKSINGFLPLSFQAETQKRVGSAARVLYMAAK